MSIESEISQPELPDRVKSEFTFGANENLGPSSQNEDDWLSIEPDLSLVSISNLQIDSIVQS